MSEYTVAQFKRSDHFYRDLDLIRVKGKSDPVKVYQLMMPNFLKKESQIREFIKIFEEARDAYSKQDWNKSKELFFNCLKMKPDDKPSSVFIERIKQFEKDPKIENWDGVYTFTHK